MSSATGFSANGLPIVSSSLPTISLRRLEDNNKDERQRLLDACITHGFYYLDLQDSADLLATWRAMIKLMEEYFEKPLSEKMRDSRGSDTQGYEPVGTSRGSDLNRVDAYESLKISRRELLNGVVDLTSSVKDQSDVLFHFMQEAHRITILLLKRLSDSLGLIGAARLEEKHLPQAASLSTLGMLKYPRHDPSLSASECGIGHNKHTDVGTLTFLLSEQWGLQILSPDTKTWAFVEPRPGHAVVNVGDSLRFTTNGKLSSVVHRVTPIREVQHEDRYSIAYFLRMQNNIQYTDGHRQWSAKEWHDFKFELFRDPFQSKEGMRCLTGGMETERYVDRDLKWLKRPKEGAHY